MDLLQKIQTEHSGVSVVFMGMYTERMHLTQLYTWNA